jgi:VIT1/CCC1 family predicted Fe2+/Mn2+ transporter
MDALPHNDSVELDARSRTLLESFQRAEMTDAVVYGRLARRERHPENREVLERIAADEVQHAAVWQSYTGKTIGARRVKALWYTLLGWVLGYTFAIKLMESGEDKTGRAYEKLSVAVPEITCIIEEECAHEETLIALLDEERLRYVGDIVLGLNDALVELTGTIAGLTFALANTRVIAMAGIITGVAATLSMAASNYLAGDSTERDDAFKASMYTGLAYLVTVVFLVLPFLLFAPGAYVWALVSMLVVAVFIIFWFNYYISVTRSQPCFRRFVRMAAISLGVAVLSFGIGLLAKKVLGVDI